MLIYNKPADPAQKDVVWPMARFSGEDQRISFFIFGSGLAGPVVISVAPADSPGNFVQVKSSNANELFNLDINGPVVIRCAYGGAGAGQVYAQ
jgi:hypothetical protein